MSLKGKYAVCVDDATACQSCAYSRSILTTEDYRKVIAYNRVGKFSFSEIQDMEKDGGPFYVRPRPRIIFYGEGGSPFDGSGRPPDFECVAVGKSDK